ncbi:hypothetical protein [uncultured Tenacibaculum sp.]|uniref:hypothetical protein n=1 Tax=uncultured Tenacibaculum sp. TaxID=174713 RepID=UPI0026134118|nr:hypothetical protein [uncultured Tenacibaculum sp.]
MEKYSRILLLFFGLLLTNCVSTKHQIDKSILKNDSLVKSTNSDQQIRISSPINELFFLPGPKSENKKIDSLLTKMFSDFKAYKKSGTNSYGIAYNKKTKGFDIHTKIGKTEDKIIRKVDTILKIKKVEVVKKEKIIKYRIPFKFWMFWLLSVVVVYFLARFRIL